MNRVSVCLYILSNKDHDQKQQCQKGYIWERKQEWQILLLAKEVP